MPDVEIDLRDDLYFEIEQLAGDEFVSEDEAIEHLLSQGLEAYTTEEPADEHRDISEEFADDMWDTAGDAGGGDPGSRGDDEPNL